MHPEIGKLIDLALADGQVTEKERSVIRRKAATLGVDAHEVEMTLDARLNQLNADWPQSSKEKFGNIRTCPACGAPINSLAMSCPGCGHILNNAKANSSVQALFDELHSLTISAPPSRELATRQSTLISSIPIPDSKEDLVDLLSMAASESSWRVATDDIEPVDGSDILRKAWISKGDQALAKAKLLFRNDGDMVLFRNECKKKIDRARRNESKRRILFIRGVIVGFFVLLFMITSIIILIRFLIRAFF